MDLRINKPKTNSFRSSTPAGPFAHVARVVALFAVGILLAGCATGRHILTAEDVIDDGKRNTILFSYDMTLNVTEKYPRITDTDVVIRCAGSNQQKHASECIRVNVPLKGRRDIDGYTYYTFAGTGAAVLQMPYGVFNLESVGHSVVVDVERYGHCFGGFSGGIGFGSGFRLNIGLGGHSRRGGFGFGISQCLPISSYVTAQYGEQTPATSAIEVKPGDGCYAGHLTLVMTDGELTDYSLDQTAIQPSAESVEALPADIRTSVRNRVTKPCQTS